MRVPIRPIRVDISARETMEVTRLMRRKQFLRSAFVLLVRLVERAERLERCLVIPHVEYWKWAFSYCQYLKDWLPKVNSLESTYLSKCRLLARLRHQVHVWWTRIEMLHTVIRRKVLPPVKRVRCMDDFEVEYTFWRDFGTSEWNQ